MAVRGEAMLLRALKVVALWWLGMFVLGIVALAALYVFALASRAIRRRLGRRQ
jgi:hypothetical protein